MLSLTIYVTAVLYLVLAVFSKAAPLTVDLVPNREECLFLDVPFNGCFVKYYFNVQDWALDDEYMSYKMYFSKPRKSGDERILFKKKNNDPNEDRVLLVAKDEQRIEEGEFVGIEKGEYQICFQTTTPKVIDFDMSFDCSDVEGFEDMPIVDPLDDNAVTLKMINDLANESKLKSLLSRLEHQVSTLRTSLDYYKLRNSRNLKTVESTLRRVTVFSLGNMVLITLISGLQLVLLKVWFARGTLRRGRKY